jgi:hypothetical protein
MQRRTNSCKRCKFGRLALSRRERGFTRPEAPIESKTCRDQTDYQTSAPHPNNSGSRCGRQVLGASISPGGKRVNAADFCGGGVACLAPHEEKFRAVHQTQAICDCEYAHPNATSRIAPSRTTRRRESPKLSKSQSEYIQDAVRADCNTFLPVYAKCDGVCSNGTTSLKIPQCLSIASI